MLRSLALRGNGLRWKGLQRSLASTSKYERKTPIEHIQLRPGMYVGSVDWSSTDHWVPDAKGVMVKRPVSVSPALLKIFDEILVNAADNHSRSKSLTQIKVFVAQTKDNLTVTIENDGPTIPVEMHPTEKLYIPELIFGHLLTGSNFNDNENRFTGGSHGYGAKLTNIFSKHFEVAIVDTKSAIAYQQKWENNMMVCNEPIVTQLAPSANTTGNMVRISFSPDLSKFGFQSMTATERTKHLKDMVAMFQRRTYDLAGCLANIQVSFNDQLIDTKSFDEYARMFLAGPERDTYRSVQISNDWFAGLALSPTDSFESVSFVNNVWTPRGGTHVQAIMSPIVKFIDKELHSRGIKKVTAASIREHLMLFLNTKVLNPSFDGQTKDALLTKATAFADVATLSPAHLQTLVVNSGILEELTNRFRIQEDNRLIAVVKKSSKQPLLEIPKLEDAHFAGSDRALECTLILTEGDSAKALAVAGISAVGREFFGVMPLRGKLLNVRVANKATISKNEELINLCRAMGLDFKRKYHGTSLAGEGLRYGRVMLMCDQDHDGSHIKGLIINFFDHFWPSLLRHEGFLQEFITPLVKVKSKATTNYASSSSSSSRTKQQQQAEQVFYNVTDYQEWRQSVPPEELSRYRIKYYKGLGTSTAAEGQEYFRAIDKHRKTFVMSSSSSSSLASSPSAVAAVASGSGSSSSASAASSPPMLLPGVVGNDRDAIDMVFNKLRVDDRKQWLLHANVAADPLDMREPTVSYRDFIAKELIHFSLSDNLRSIPSVIDGLKPSQRKVLFGALKKNLVADEMKVVQLAGYIAEQTAYHHGEAALHSTIVNMAQDFVGANNIPLLEPIGQFGTRAKGGNDFASPRYIFTKLSPLARLLFPAEDDAILTYQEEDGVVVEPKFYLPVIPFVLVNGVEGIGTGWSTSIPPHHPLQIVEAVERKLRKRMDPNGFTTTATATATATEEALLPWVAGFRGTIAMGKTRGTRSGSSGSSGSSNEAARALDDAVDDGEDEEDDEEDEEDDDDEEDEEEDDSDEDSDLLDEDAAATALVNKALSRANEPFVVTSGVLERLNRTTVAVTELPYLKWTEDYKRFLVGLIAKGHIKSFKEMHTADRVRFEITAPAAWLDHVMKEAASAEKAFRLSARINLNNMHAFTAQGRMHRFHTAEEILDHHFDERWRGYTARKAAMMEQQARHEMLVRNRARFVDDIVAGRLRLSANDAATGGWQARSLADLERELRQSAFDAMPKTPERPFDYLLSMSLQSLTMESAQTLRRNADVAQKQLDQLRQQTEATLWLHDLQQLRSGYQSYLSHRYASEHDPKSTSTSSSASNGTMITKRSLSTRSKKATTKTTTKTKTTKAKASKTKTTKKTTK